MLLDFAFQPWGMAAGSIDTGRLVANALARLTSGPQRRLPPDTKVFHFPMEAAACENMVLLVAVDMGLQASSGCRGVVDAAVGMGNQAASRDGIDTLTPKCIEGLADLLASYGLNPITTTPPAPGEAGAAQQLLFWGTAGCSCSCSSGPRVCRPHRPTEQLPACLMGAGGQCGHQVGGQHLLVLREPGHVDDVFGREVDQPLPQLGQGKCGLPAQHPSHNAGHVGSSL